MNFRECLDRAVAGGMIKQEHAKFAGRVYADAERAFVREFGPTGGPEQAAAKAMEALERDHAERTRRLMLQRDALKRTRNMAAGAVNTKGEQDLGEGLIGLIDDSDLVPGISLASHSKAVRGVLHAKMAQVLEHFRPTVTGATRNVADLTHIVRELFGENTGNEAAREMAQAWLAAAELARLRFNAAGGAIAKRADWGMPQNHDSDKVRAAGRAAWVDYVMDGRLDRGRMIDNDTSLPFTDERLREVLGEVHDTISSRGWNHKDPSMRPLGAGALATRRTDPRFLVFKSADTWMAYQAKFGDSDAFSTMMGHIDHMARDIAAMELFGPNPQATLNYMIQHQTKLAAGLGGAAPEQVAKKAFLMQNAWAIARGTNATPINAKLANLIQITKNLLTSAQLGSAAIPAFLTDPNFSRIAAGMNGLDATRLMGRYIALLNPADAGHRRIAVRLGLIADNWSSIALAQRRYAGELMGSTWSKRLSHTVMTMTGLSPHTQAMRWAFGMEFAGTLADHVKKDFASLPKALRESMTRHGIDAADWDIARKAPLYTVGGASFLRAEDVVDPRLVRNTAKATAARITSQWTDKTGPSVGDKLLAMIHAETEYAVPSFSLRGEAHFQAGVRPGTVPGALIASGLMYRNFGITLAMTHMRRQALQFLAAPNVAAKSRVVLAGLDLVVSTTLLGALSLQLKQIAAGRDPKPMGEHGLDPSFWGAAMLQGGGIGVFGDFVFTDVNQYGSGLPVTVAGAPIGFADDVRKITLGNALELAQGRDTHFGGEAAAFAKRYTPGSSIWYARLALERLFFDRLDSWVNPKSAERMERLEQKYRNEFGQRFWWRPGALAPEASPNLANALTDTPQPEQ